MLIHLLPLGESNRKDREFLFLLDAVHVDGNVVEVFKFFLFESASSETQCLSDLILSSNEDMKTPDLCYF